MRKLTLLLTWLGCFGLSGCTVSGGSSVDPHRTCQISDGVTECWCAEGWEEDGAKGCRDTDECALAEHACDPHATCTNVDGSYECDCKEGWEGDGHSCIDVNECDLVTGPCGPHALCLNEPGSFSCSCDEGFQEDGQTCIDINECSDGSHACSAHAACQNTLGGYTCSCNLGWTGNGHTCDDVNECLKSPCAPEAECTNTDGGYLCSCSEGWDGDGTSCSDIDECQADTSPCGPNADCLNTEGSYECVCNEGWEWNGSSCVPTCGDGICDAGETCQTCGQDCSSYGANEITAGLDEEEEAFLIIINEYRAENGLGELEACHSLNRAAQGHSEDMRDQNYFSHDGLNGSNPWARACASCYELGCGPKTAMAENLAAGNADAQSTFIQWKNSPGHNKNMLKASVSYIGIGRATGGGKYGVYWTNVFGGGFEQSCE